MKYFKLVIITLTFCAVCACGDDKGGGNIEQLHRTGPGVFICNEGNFSGVSGSLSFYDRDRSHIENDVYFRSNGKPLGDVCYSMTVVDGRGFAVVNNSGMVAVIDTGTFRKTGEITGLTSPRHIIEHEGNIYISDLYDNKITVVDLDGLTLTGHIELGSDNGRAITSERLVSHGGYIFTTSWSYDNKLIRIAPSARTVDKIIEVDYQPNSLVVDSAGTLWVLCDGGNESAPGGPRNGTLLRVDPVSMEVLERYEFDDPIATPSKLCTDTSGSSLYFLYSAWSAGAAAGGVYRMNIGEGRLPGEAIIEAGDRSFYGLGVDPATGDIYVSDSRDYLQRGTVYRYSSDGRTLRDEIRAGIIPGYFCFIE